MTRGSGPSTLGPDCLEQDIEIRHVKAMELLSTLLGEFDPEELARRLDSSAQRPLLPLLLRKRERSPLVLDRHPRPDVGVPLFGGEARCSRRLERLQKGRRRERRRDSSQVLRFTEEISPLLNQRL